MQLVVTSWNWKEKNISEMKRRGAVEEWKNKDVHVLGLIEGECFRNEKKRSISKAISCDNSENSTPDILSFFVWKNWYDVISISMYCYGAKGCTCNILYTV